MGYGKRFLGPQSKRISCMLQGRKDNKAISYRRLKFNDRSDATTYEGGGGDDNRRCGFKAIGLEFAVRVAVPVPEAN